MGRPIPRDQQPASQCWLLSVRRAQSVEPQTTGRRRWEGRLAARYPTTPPLVLGEAAMGGGKMMPAIRAGFPICKRGRGKGGTLSSTRYQIEIFLVERGRFFIKRVPVFPLAGGRVLRGVPLLRLQAEASLLAPTRFASFQGLRVGGQGRHSCP